MLGTAIKYPATRIRSRSALARPQQFNSRTLLETMPPCPSLTSRKSALSELFKNTIPGKQMSCTWKNSALYLISSVCDEPTAGFNRCGLWKPSAHLSESLGHKAWSAHAGSPTGDTADKGRLDTLPWPDTSVVAHQPDGCSPAAGRGALLSQLESSAVSQKAMLVSNLWETEVLVHEGTDFRCGAQGAEGRENFC